MSRNIGRSIIVGYVVGSVVGVATLFLLPWLEITHYALPVVVGGVIGVVVPWVVPDTARNSVRETSF